MALTNAEKQKRWRDRRNALAKEAKSEWVMLLNRTICPPGSNRIWRRCSSREPRTR
jgi:hypothetical protein